MDRLLVVEPGDVLKRYYFEKLCDCEVEVFVAGKKYPAFLDELVPRSHFINSDPYNPQKLIADVVSFMHVKKINFAGVGTFFEHAVPSTAFLGATLGLPQLPASAAFLNSQNKLLMRERCAKGGVSSPQYELLADLTPENLVSTLKRIGLPCVLKPLFGNQSSGVIKIESLDQVNVAIEWARSSWSYSQEDAFCNFSGSFLVEEYLPGKIITGDGLVQKGRVLCVYSVEIPLGEEPYFVQTGNIIPARIPDVYRGQCESLVERICHSLGFDNCGFHAEFRFDPTKGLQLIEIAARLPGGHIVKAYEQAFGVNLIAAQVAVWLGKTVEPVLLVPRLSSSVIHKGIYPASSGIFSLQSNLSELRDTNGVLEITQVTGEGEHVSAGPSNRKPLFFYAIRSESFPEAYTLAEKLEKEIKYKIT
jgi:biotin carboxylase